MTVTAHTDPALYAAAVSRTKAHKALTQLDIDRSRMADCYLFHKKNTHRCPLCRTAAVCHTCRGNEAIIAGKCSHHTPTVGHLLVCTHDATRRAQLQWHNRIVMLIATALHDSKARKGRKALYLASKVQRPGV